MRLGVRVGVAADAAISSVTHNAAIGLVSLQLTRPIQLITLRAAPERHLDIVALKNIYKHTIHRSS